MTKGECKRKEGRQGRPRELPCKATMSGPSIAPQFPRDELILTANDVVCGRKTGVTFWPGNTIFRYICWRLKDTYRLVHRKSKGDFSKIVMEEMASILDPPARFVELPNDTQDVADGRCYMAPMNQAVEKVCQTLREKKLICPPGIAELLHKQKEKNINVLAPKLEYVEDNADMPCFRRIIKEQVEIARDFILSWKVSKTIISRFPSHTTPKVPVSTIASNATPSPNKTVHLANILSLIHAKRKICLTEHFELYYATPKKRQMSKRPDKTIGQKVSFSTIPGAVNVVPVQYIQKTMLPDVSRAISNDSCVTDIDSAGNEYDEEHLPENSFHARIFASPVRMAQPKKPPNHFVKVARQRNARSVTISAPPGKPCQLWQGNALTFYTTWLPTAIEYPPMSYPFCFAHNARSVRQKEETCQNATATVATGSEHCHMATAVFDRK